MSVRTAVTEKVQERPAETITGFAGAVLFALNAFGVPITEDQNLAIIGLVAFLPAAVTYIVNLRRKAKEV